MDAEEAADVGMVLQFVDPSDVERRLIDSSVAAAAVQVVRSLTMVGSHTYSVLAAAVHEEREPKELVQDACEEEEFPDGLGFVGADYQDVVGLIGQRADSGGLGRPKQRKREEAEAAVLGSSDLMAHKVTETPSEGESYA